MFACLYPALCDIARANGYALAIHGSVTTDLDLVAIPWVETACDAEALMQEIMQRLDALNYRQLLERDCGRWADDAKIDEMIKGARARNGGHRGPLDCAIKPHGRKAWNLYLLHGIKIDLSVMPPLR